MGIIDFSNVSYTYDGKSYALDSLDVTIEQGSFVCILGGNGSGKSTLAKHINALLVPDGGTVQVLGYSTSDQDNLYTIRSNAGMVFQNPDDQLVASIIEDDVAFGPENLGIPAPEIRDRVTTSLAKVGLQGFEKRETSALSGGQKQRLAIAGVLAMEPTILILDEAGAMLDPRGRAGLMRVCHELHENGLTILMITHHMDDAAQAQRVIILDNGHIVLDGTPQDVLSQSAQIKPLSLDVPYPTTMSQLLQDSGVPLSLSITNEDLVAALKQQVPPHAETAPDIALSDLRYNNTPPQTKLLTCEESSSTPPLIEFKDVSFSYAAQAKKKRKSVFSKKKDSRIAPTKEKPADWGNNPEKEWSLSSINFSVNQGDFIGIAGHTGSGKSTLIQLANGLLKPNSGTVLINGVDISDKKAANKARSDVGVVFQYPEHQLFAATVYDDVAFGPRNMGLDSTEIERRVRKALEKVHISYDEVFDKSPFSLSGGQQRRVALAGVLAMEPKTLILDEPTAGLDPKGKEELVLLIKDLHMQHGLTILVVSHNMDDLARLCNTLIILNQGEIYAKGSPRHVFRDAEKLHAVGLDVPHSVNLAHSLITEGILSPEDLKDANWGPWAHDSKATYTDFSAETLASCIACRVGTM